MQLTTVSVGVHSLNDSRYISVWIWKKSWIIMSCSVLGYREWVDSSSTVIKTYVHHKLLSHYLHKCYKCKMLHLLPKMLCYQKNRWGCIVCLSEKDYLHFCMSDAIVTMSCISQIWRMGAKSNMSQLLYLLKLCLAAMMGNGLRVM